MIPTSELRLILARDARAPDLVTTYVRLEYGDGNPEWYLAAAEASYGELVDDMDECPDRGGPKSPGVLARIAVRLGGYRRRGSRA